MYREVTMAAIFWVKVDRGKKTGCTVPDCDGGVRDLYGLRWHFTFQHYCAEVQMEDEPETTPCTLCGMHVADAERYRGSTTCAQLVKQCGNERLAKEQVEAETVGFMVNGGAIKRVHKFQYLGRVLSEDDRDTVCI